MNKKNLRRVGRRIRSANKLLLIFRKKHLIFWTYNENRKLRNITPTVHIASKRNRGKREKKLFVKSNQIEKAANTIKTERR